MDDGLLLYMWPVIGVLGTVWSTSALTAFDPKPLRHQELGDKFIPCLIYNRHLSRFQSLEVVYDHVHLNRAFTGGQVIIGRQEPHASIAVSFTSSRGS